MFCSVLRTFNVLIQQSVTNYKMSTAAQSNLNTKHSTKNPTQNIRTHYLTSTSSGEKIVSYCTRCIKDITASKVISESDKYFFPPPN